MTADRRVARLEEFLAERGKPLLQAAILLTGSKEAGEDLLQAALERTELVSVRTFRVQMRDPALKQTTNLAVTVTTTLWVDPASYLPVRWAQDGKVTGRKGIVVPSVNQDVEWLPPTGANLVQLTVPIPSGFTRVSSPS
jgi:hypothetical protein